MADAAALAAQNELLRERLTEAQAVLEALGRGEVDALMVGAPGSRKVFTLEGAETPYRTFVEAMQEGAATVDADGSILYGNQALARLAGRPLKHLVGTPARDLVLAEDQGALEDLLRAAAGAPAQRELRVTAPERAASAALFMAAPIRSGEAAQVALVIADLSERERSEASHRRLEQSERSRRALLSVLEDQKRAERKLRKANRALRTLSAGNEALVRATEEAGLLTEMTRILTRLGGCVFAMVGYRSDDAEKSIAVRACDGIELQAFASLALSWDDNARGQTAMGRAIRLGSTQLAREPASDADHAHCRAMLESLAVSALLALPLRLAPGDPPFGALVMASASAEGFSGDEAKLFEELAGDLAFGVATLRTREAQRAADDTLRKSLEDSLQAIAATVEVRDPYTAGHQRRVAELATAIAREMGLDEARIRGLHLAGTVHDLGKIGVPAEILAKPARLSRIEFSLVKEHAQAGYDILKDVRFPWPIARMVLEHHERLDGSGYPQGLKGEEILLESRVLGVADVMEAMASHRPYRPGLGLEAALGEIERGRGTAYEPLAVDACLRLFREGRFSF